MDQTLRLRPKLDFRELPGDWQLLALCVDWDCEPLLLFSEGPSSIYSRQVPKAHHLVYFESDVTHQIRFGTANELPWLRHAQRFEDGWLLGGSRGGDTGIFSAGGQKVRTLDLGDASEHVQTTREGRIWVGYFDEGVYGNGVGQAGLACFDKDGKQVFSYAALANENALPYIDDCYTLNVAEDSVFISYYSAFPLVEIRNFQVKNLWPDFGSSKAIAVSHGECLKFSAYGPLVTSLVSLTGKEMTRPIDLRMPNGDSIPRSDDPYDPVNHRFRSAARGARGYIYDDKMLYEVPWQQPPR